MVKLAMKNLSAIKTAPIVIMFLHCRGAASWTTGFTSMTKSQLS